MPAAFDPTRLDWNLLRALCAVIENGSLTRAAAHLGLSQPTLSRHIATLELAVGAPLFERSTRRLRASTQALAMAEPVARMLAAAQACAQAAAAPTHQLAGTVRLTASQVVAAHVLPAMLVRLAATHPEIQIELIASDMLDNLQEREADIAVRMVQPTQGAVITRHLMDWPLGFYAHRDLLGAAGAGGAAGPAPAREGAGRARAMSAELASGTAPSLKNLAALRWIGMDQSTQLIDGFRRAGHTIDRRFFDFRCDSPLVSFEALRAGLGVGIAMQALAEREPLLVRVLPELALPVLPVWLTAHRELRSSRRLRAVFDFLARELVAWDQPARGALRATPRSKPKPKPTATQAPARARKLSARRSHR